VDAAGVFHQIPRIDDVRLAEIFAREVLAMLVRKELLIPIFSSFAAVSFPMLGSEVTGVSIPVFAVFCAGGFFTFTPCRACFASFIPQPAGGVNPAQSRGPCRSLFVGRRMISYAIGDIAFFLSGDIK
jgi:hypothetical protein